jgi:hypothetical protein
MAGELGMSSERRITPSDPEWGLGRSSRSTGYRSRSFYLPDDLFFRLRNAAWHTQMEAQGFGSISELVTDVLRQEVEWLEQQYNEGEPFAEIPDGRTPRAGPSGRARQAHAVREMGERRRERQPTAHEDQDAQDSPSTAVKDG